MNHKESLTNHIWGNQRNGQREEWVEGWLDKQMDGWTEGKMNGWVDRKKEGLLWTISLVHFSRSVVSDSLRPHELQHARSPCPSRILPNCGKDSGSPWLLTLSLFYLFIYFCSESVLAGVGEAQVFSILISSDLHLRMEIIFSLCSLEAPAESGVF